MTIDEFKWTAGFQPVRKVLSAQAARGPEDHERLERHHGRAQRNP
jgi:hypothetical protein